MKIWKSLAVLLLSLEFLTPAFVSDYSSFEASGQQYLQDLSDDKKNPTLFVAEETDVEEGQRENQVHKTILMIVKPVLCALQGEWKACFQLPAAPQATQSFDTHPPLFRLHCLLLL